MADREEVVRTDALRRRSRARRTTRRSRPPGLVFVAGQVGLKPGGEMVGDSIEEQTEQVLQEPRGDPRGGRKQLRQVVNTTMYLAGLRRLRGDERGLRPHVGDSRPRARPCRSRRSRWAPRSRSRWSRTSEWRRVTRSPTTCTRSASTRTSSAGAVRDELLGLPARARLRRPRRGLRRAARSARAARARRGPRGRRPARRAEAATARQGRSGARSRPGSSSRRRAPSARRGLAGTTSRSSPTPASRWSRTWRAATSRSTRSRSGSRPASCSIRSAGATTSSARAPHGLARRASARTRCGSSAGSASSPQLDLDPDEETLRRCARGAESTTSRPSASAAGSRADGMGELSKLLLGAHPAKALRLARDTGVLVRAAAGVRAGDRLRAEERAPAPAARRAHLRGRPGRRRRRRAAGGAPRRAPPRPRQARRRSGTEATHAGDRRGRSPACRCSRRLRYPTRLRRHVVRRSSRAHVRSRGDPAPVDARRFLARHGERARARHRRAQARGRSGRARAYPTSESRRLGRFRTLVEQEREQPHRLSDLAIDGGDLMSSAASEGPGLGEVLATLLERVVEDPALNTPRAAARREAGELRRDPLGLPGRRTRSCSRPASAGVSEGPFASLNLGRLTRDDEEHVEENRRRLCAEVGADVATARAQSPAALGASSTVREAGSRGEPGDGLWTDEPGVPDAGAHRRLPADRARARRDRAGARRAPRGLARAARGDRRRRVRALGGGAQRRGRAGDRARAATRSGRRWPSRFASASARTS